MSEYNYNTTITLEQTKFIIFKSIKTFFVYAILCAIPPLVLKLDAMLSAEFRSESSITENLQLLMLFCSIAFFAHLAYKLKELKRACVLIAGFFLVLFIRENDGLLDNIYHGFWFPVALVVTFTTITYFLLDYKNAFTQFARLLKAPPMQLIIFALAFLLVFSRLFGMGSFWRLIMNKDFVYAVKSMIEEGTELLGYVLICFGSFRLNRFILSQHKAKETNKIT